MGFDGRWVRTATRTRTAAAVARSSSKWNRQRPRVWSGTRIASGASSVASSLTWTITRATRARFTVSHTSRNSSNRNRLRSPTSLVSRSHPTVYTLLAILRNCRRNSPRNRPYLLRLISANLSGRFDITASAAYTDSAVLSLFFLSFLSLLYTRVHFLLHRPWTFKRFEEKHGRDFDLTFIQFATRSVVLESCIKNLVKALL